MARTIATKEQRLLRMTHLELPLWENGVLVGGVDEAGRGPYAGNVVAACVVMPHEPDALLLGVNDSKKLSEAAREKLYPLIIERALSYGIGQASVEEIERLNIKQAARLAMKRAIEQTTAGYVLIDAEKALDIRIQQSAIVHGDAESYLIACASILAKVTRDHQMLELDKQYPQYGFAQHKGYGTKAHEDAILQYGPCPQHRMSFLRNLYARAGRPLP